MNLILACDTAKMLNHDFIEPCVTNQFYLRAKHDIYFVGLRAMIEKYFTKPITEEDIEEAEAVLSSRGQLKHAKLNRWRDIVKEYGGKLPITIRSVPEGSFVKAGTPIMTIEATEPYAWLPYVIDSLIIQSIWYPSSLATRLMKIKKELYWCNEPQFIYDIAPRASETQEGSEIAAATVKMVFENYDSIHGDMYLWKHYDYQPKAMKPVYLSEHNHIIGWKSEKEFCTRLNAIENDSIAVCLVDTYNVDSCLELLQSDEIVRLAKTKNISLYVNPDSTQTTRELKAIYDKIKSTSLGIVKSSLDAMAARSMSKLGFDEGRLLFMLEDSVLKEGLARTTYGFEYKQCAVKREVDARWDSVNKAPDGKPEFETLKGLQFPHGAETVFISGHVMGLSDYFVTAKRLTSDGDHTDHLLN